MADGRHSLVLVVDDHERLRSVLAATLEERLPARVLEAGDVTEALALVQTEDFDALLVDVNLHRVSGLDAVPQLRAACPRARIVMMSGAAVPGLEARALRAGADHFIPKTVDLDGLCLAVQPTWMPHAP